MTVEEIMARQLITISPQATLDEAIRLMYAHRIRHLPVVDAQGALAGILSDRDVRTFVGTAYLSGEHCLTENDHVADAMTSEVVTTTRDTFVEEAARVMIERRIDSLPVVEGKQLLGLITDTDLLKTLIAWTGVLHPSSRVEIEVDDSAAALAELLKIFAAHRLNIDSLMMVGYTPAGKRRLVVRFTALNYLPIVQEIRTKGMKVFTGLPGEEIADTP
ncbi:MAG: CBS domain-containing protein [Firmicutes bacterium]|nr:CBS domain-containing protein [Bacillota bacterium]